jgi:hypothetical protein
VPFTLAHPAAVLPLRGLRYLDTAPLVIGALVPDLPYFVPAKVMHHLPVNLMHYSHWTHDFPLSYAICLPLGYLLLLAIYVLRQPLTALLSPRARWLCLGALEPFRRGWSAWAVAAVAIVLGVSTHLLWDGFTHSDGWIVRRVSALSAPVTIGAYNGPRYHVLQYVSSAVGLLILALWYWRLPAPPPTPPGPGETRLAVGPILVPVASAAVLIGGWEASEYFPVIYKSLDIFLTHSLAWFALLYLLAGIIITLKHRSGAEVK